MLDFQITRSSYERMPEFTMLLDAERVKVRIIYTDKLVVSVKEKDEERFRKLANKEKIEIQLEQYIKTLY